MRSRYAIGKSAVYAAGAGRRYQNLWWQRRVKTVSPWTDWNFEHSVAFVHIPKTGGTSIYDIFSMDKPTETHCNVVGYKSSSPELWERAFSFAFVRNPWDRFVSAFHYLKRDPLSVDDKSWAEEVLGEYDDFDAFLDRFMTSTRFRGQVMMWRHFSPQWWFLSDAAGKTAVDHICRFESFDSEIDRVAEKIGLSAQRVHANKVSRAHYSSFYTPGAIDFVARVYKQDVERFDYSFDR